MLAGQVFGGELQDPPFHGCKLVQSGHTAAQRLLLIVPPQQVPGDRRTQEHFAPSHGEDAIDEIRHCVFFENVSGDTAVHGQVEQAFILVHRQGDHSHRRLEPLQIQSQIQPAPTRQLNVQHRHLRLETTDLRQRLPGIAGGARKLEARIRGDHLGQTLPKNRVIIDNKNLDAHGNVDRLSAATDHRSATGANAFTG